MVWRPAEQAACDVLQQLSLVVPAVFAAALLVVASYDAPRRSWWAEPRVSESHPQPQGELGGAAVVRHARGRLDVATVALVPVSYIALGRRQVVVVQNTAVESLDRAWVAGTRGNAGAAGLTQAVGVLVRSTPGVGLMRYKQVAPIRHTRVGQLAGEPVGRGEERGKKSTRNVT